VTVKITIAAPFKHTRKTGMRKNELVYYYALDRKWMSTDQANLLLSRAEEDGLLGQQNGVFSPRFDINEIIIPVGFKPTSSIFERNDPSQVLIGRIAKAQGMQETAVVSGLSKTSLMEISCRQQPWSCLQKNTMCLLKTREMPLQVP
jgi:hypothetical protein